MFNGSIQPLALLRLCVRHHPGLPRRHVVDVLALALLPEPVFRCPLLLRLPLLPGPVLLRPLRGMHRRYGGM